MTGHVAAARVLASTGSMRSSTRSSMARAWTPGNEHAARGRKAWSEELASRACNLDVLAIARGAVADLLSGMAVEDALAAMFSVRDPPRIDGLWQDDARSGAGAARAGDVDCPEQRRRGIVESPRPGRGQGARGHCQGTGAARAAAAVQEASHPGRHRRRPGVPP